MIIVFFAELLRDAWFRDAAGIVRRRAWMEFHHSVSYVSLYRWRQGKTIPQDSRMIPIFARVLGVSEELLWEAYKKDLGNYSAEGRKNFLLMV